MIDLSKVYEIKNVLSNKVIDKIEDELGNIIYEAWKNLPISGIPPLTLLKSKGEDLINYIIKGNSIQNGTPTPDAPVEIESVGDKTVNLWYAINSYKITGDGTSLEIKSSPITNAVFKKNTQYTISFNVETSGVEYNETGNLVFFDILYTDNTHTYAGVNSSNYTNSKVSVKSLSGKTIQKINSITKHYRFTGGTIEISNIQLQEGTVATEFEPYGKYKIPVKVSNDTEEIITNIYLNEPLRKVGDYADYIDFENKKVVRYVEEVILNGAETIFQYNAINGFTVAYVLNQSVNSAYGLCSHFNVIRNFVGTTGINIGSSNSSCYLKGVNNIATTSGEMSTWLTRQYNNGTPVKIMYQLAKPIDEPIELPNIPTHKGTTIIEIDTKIQPSNMEVVYKGKPA